ncbi:phosphatidylinositol-4-phosphate 5-kinase [Anaeramoeba flamelloides]|uniref:Phosphatidylinositol-4-phosphate 5-kinase n=1 Tax=Anaeramoeba flamelloides TaxID=1746091 RepID=A0AAV7ZC44_9EUKA|nr:phosphatidylinositol-4-phosphate 5-kinase [Anaeramoeba flamelloides]
METKIDSIEELFDYSLESPLLTVIKQQEPTHLKKSLKSVSDKTINKVYNEIRSLTDTVLTTTFQQSLQIPEVSRKVNKLVEDLPRIGKLFEQNVTDKSLFNDQLQNLQKKEKKQQEEVSKKKISEYLELTEMYYQTEKRILSEIQYIQDAVQEGIEDWMNLEGKEKMENKKNTQKKSNPYSNKTKNNSQYKSPIRKFASNSTIQKKTPSRSPKVKPSKTKSENSTTNMSDILEAFKQGIRINNELENKQKFRQVYVKENNFNEITKIELDSMMNKINTSNDSNQPKEQPSFTFQELSPLIFYHLRVHFNISNKQYEKSICLEENGVEVMKQDGGRSGASFFLSKDKKFVVKFIEKSESNVLTQILKDYYQYIITNPHTLLTLFYGHYSISTSTENYYCIVMNNVFPKKYQMHDVYDLKGSKINRGGDRKKKNLRILKDNDLNDELRLTKILRNKLIRQINSDTEFLKKFSIMDYSLLLGIHHLDEKDENNESSYNRSKNNNNNNNNSNSNNKSNNNNNKLKKKESVLQFLDFKRISDFKRAKGGIRSVGDEQNRKKSCIYYFGIIDCLQVYNVKKKVEHGFKTLKHFTRTEMSSVEPELYASRFINLVKKITTTPKKYK